MARRWLWAQGQERRSVAGVTSLIDLCQRTHITDIMFLGWTSGGSVPGVFWNSSYFQQSSERVDSQYFMDYLVGRCSAVNIRVHCWLTIGGFQWLWAYRNAGLPSSWNCSGGIAGWSFGNWLNMTRADVQQAVGDAAADCVNNISGLAGVQLDYIRVPQSYPTEPVPDPDDVTACTQKAYNAISPLDADLTAAVVPHTFPGFDKNNCAQDWPGWLDAGILQRAIPMLYYTANVIETQINFINTESTTVQDSTTIGVAPASPTQSYYSVGQWEEILDVVINNGFDLAIFDDTWVTNFDGIYETALEDRPVEPEPEVGESKDIIDYWLDSRTIPGVA